MLLQDAAKAIEEENQEHHVCSRPLPGPQVINGSMKWLVVRARARTGVMHRFPCLGLSRCIGIESAA